MSWLFNWLKNLILYKIPYTLLFGFVSVICIIYVKQRSIIYVPYMPEDSRTNILTPRDYGMAYEDTWLNSKDGTKLHAYWVFLNHSYPTLIYCHANAGNMGHRLFLVQKMVMNMKMNVLIFSYRGYGRSEGYAYEEGMSMDAQAALDFVLSKNLDKSKIIVFGQSIGGAVAIKLASDNIKKIKALIVENTFTAIADLIPRIFPMLEYLTFLCTEKWESLHVIKSKLESFSELPALFLSGASDELIPPDHMKKLFDLINKTGNNKQKFVSFANGTHNDTCIQPGYDDAIEDFIKSLE